MHNFEGYGKNMGICDRASEAIVPRLFDNQDIHTKSGAEFGAFRPSIYEPKGGYRLTYDEEIRCKLVVPYQVVDEKSFTSNISMILYNSDKSSVNVLHTNCIV